MQETLLIVDDIELNREILFEEFVEQYNILEAENGKEALKIVSERTEDISAILLDLIMPEIDGIQVLRELSWKNLTQKIPVFIITTEKNNDKLTEAYNLGAVDIISKPFNMDFMKKRISNIVELFRYKNSLQKEVEEQYEKFDSINIELIETLASIIEFRDCNSTEHVKRIHELTKLLMTKLCDMYEEYKMPYSQIIKISHASLLHDIGKISIQDMILNKPARLDTSEFNAIKLHTVKGCEILKKFEKLLDKETYEYAYDICRHHHERHDGHGYPDGLKGDQITPWAQVVSIVDVYDALVSPRIYKKAYSHSQAVTMINSGECGVFNPKLLEAFNSILLEIQQLNEN